MTTKSELKPAVHFLILRQQGWQRVICIKAYSDLSSVYKQLESDEAAQPLNCQPIQLVLKKAAAPRDTQKNNNYLL